MEDLLDRYDPDNALKEHLSKENSGCRVKGTNGYAIFSEQYLEKPSEIKGMTTPSATVCTWRGIPTIDDPDFD